MTAYLDESGTHDASPVSVMAGYVGTSTQWERFEADWTALVRKSELQYIHAVELAKRTKQFRGWKAENAKALAISLESVIATHLQLGFSVVIRNDDFKGIYGAGPNPRRFPKDTKYGVCFRACLAFVPSYIASERGTLARETTLNFVLEDSHRNVGDARRLFDLYKADVLPEWKHLVGTFDVSKKDSAGGQAADFLSYCIYRRELLEHGQRPSLIEKSSWVADTPLIANTYPRRPVGQTGPMVFRIPINREVLQSLKDDLFALDAERRARKL